jgi:endonuclease III
MVPVASREVQLFLVTGLLRRHWVGTEDWGAISKYPAESCPKKIANTFLLCCLLDYQISADKAWENGDRLARVLGNPDDIWAKITSHTEQDWKSRFREFRLHRYPAAHNRLWRIGKEICSYFDGDARKIWQDSSAFDVLCRLNYIGAGEQISRMIVGALRDVGQIKGTGDVKADVHVCRVIGRVFFGEQTNPEAATELTRQLSPNDPWQLDRTLWTIGTSFCHPKAPECPKCYLSAQCAYAQGQGGSA